jgi:LPS-assembly protein
VVFFADSAEFRCAPWVRIIHDMVRLSLITALCLSIEWLAAASPARGQAPQSTLGGCRMSQLQYLTFQTITRDHLKLDGTPEIPVQVDCDQVQFFADHMEIFRDTNRVLASGHVVFVSGNNRISAERMDFNTGTRTGTFYVASGTATLGNRVERSMFGTQEPDAYFWGEELQKLGPKKYRITRGGFTACVQPTPRWELISGTATINLDDYALLRNTVFKVKNVPVMYLPIFYYPIQEDDRATGFIMPIYGTSTYRGQTLSNQFFWAISRSQDATFAHDWFSKTGQGYGAEYRYIASAASDGNARVHVIREKATPDDSGNVTPGLRSFDLRGSARHRLPWNTRLSAHADYTSDFRTSQRYQQNIFDASNRTRRFDVSTSTTWPGFTLNSSYGRAETFFNNNTESVLNGTRPRVTLSRTPTRLGRSPVYVQGGIDYANYLRESRTATELKDLSLQRFDMGGGFRVAFPTFSFLTVNSNLQWQGTRYTRSLAPSGETVPESVFRDYVELSTQVVGPVFTRIWTRPGSRFAERIKHLIEPSVQLRRVSAVENVAQIVKFESSDYEIGGNLRTTYALTTRMLIKPGGERGVSRELLRVRIQQTHYGNPAASAFDPNYPTSFLSQTPNSYSPVALTASVNPAEGSTANLQLEYDPEVSGIRSISTGGSVLKRLGDVTGLYSRRRTHLGAGRFREDNLVSAGANLRTRRNTLGGNYNFYYDITESTMVQQRILGYYNAQCCGVSIEYQTLNTAPFNPRIQQDRRFNISFTLAGIGTFSNFLGALTGQPDRR